MFVIAIAMPWYFEIPLIFDITSRDFNPLIVASAVFAGVGAIMLMRTFLGVARAGKFGNASLSPNGASRGQLFRPVMLTKVDIETIGDFVLTLKCIRRSRGGDDFDSRGSSTDKVLWKHAENCPGSTRSSVGVSAMFRIPSDVPRTGQEEEPNATNVRWELTVTAPVRGVNFRQDFPITVR
jgi:hypothetical protein